MLGILMYGFQGNKLASGILFAVLLNFKHIYMYLAVIFPYSLFCVGVELTSAVSPACIFRLFAAFFLHVPFWGTSNQEFSITSKCSYRGVCHFFWTVHPHGPNSTRSVPIVSLHQGLESRVLGSQCVGFSDRYRSSPASMYETNALFRRVQNDFLLADVRRTGADITINTSGVASTSRGLVGDTIFAVLPNIKPVHTFVITLLFQSVSS